MNSKDRSLNLIRVAVVCGTRPEAIKMAPVVAALENHPGIDVKLVSTGQHREMLVDVFDLFNLSPDVDLDVMESGQGLAQTSAKMITGVSDALTSLAPDMALVHGDTNTTVAAALASFYLKIPLGHVEAGLRTGDMSAPWPEEGNRKMVGALATRHYAPTNFARDSLLAENVSPESIVVTGNTVIDALLSVVCRLEADGELTARARSGQDLPDDGRRLVLVTGHRRENFGAGFEGICAALASLAQRDDIRIVYPVHLNPSVREPVQRLLGAASNVHLIEPQGYLSFIDLMRRAELIITDSGGIQEEAPALQKPVLVMRETTERPEALDAGTVRLVGTDSNRIVAEATLLLDDESIRREMCSARNPFGDGTAAIQIAEDIFSLRARGAL